ncbi:MAG: Asp-tRNA(Asn)/Glu-tRNA(Gln) amidotransferase subunit GatB [bacterium]|nr:Asp-tRNA(Asn)/Glu-tRNA(Gln) amidotransferase subunit GatB [bacterium]
MEKYIPTIGLEIHAELNTKSKMFCSCPNTSLENEPNTNICPVCMGHPGTLPVANIEAIRKILLVGRALECELASVSKFDRKHYFYPDLPKGYQISQYDMPLCERGVLDIEGKVVRITRIHLEEDAGKLLHPSGSSHTLVDYNRAGAPLMELVTEPDLSSASEARVFAQELQLVLRYLKASDADMEKGQMRIEANISIRPKGTETLGTKVEVKNLNSFRNVEQAISYELKRQEELLKSGGVIIQETRGWDEKKGETYLQREKEEAHDYRYFPEPDLPPIMISEDELNGISALVPELPVARRKRFQEEFSISASETELFVQLKELGEYFEKVVSEFGEQLSFGILSRQIHLAVNYMQSDLIGILRGRTVTDQSVRLTPENFAELIILLQEEKISSAIAKSLLKEMVETGADPSNLLEDRGIALIKDKNEVEHIAKEIIVKNPKAVEDFKNGKENALQFLVGQMMGATKGAVSPEGARDILKKLLI